ncbi:MAG: FAD-dependent 5-carboxymethylaminomethyl-2-thiouridine(34) oxidoreductase MnmC [Emcibacter sp.]|nr:FAD-dependent 5-carboxymethylaminomethyl-2-thiouridine(34) oxidoreductase MnmC [Emcibacter sp.]
MTNKDLYRQNEQTQPPAYAQKPWFRRPDPLAKGSHIAIIGGGIAGLTTGLALQNSGYRVTIYEQDTTPMNKASGNPAAILDPTLSQGREGDFTRTALYHALSFYQSLGPEIFLAQERELGQKLGQKFEMTKIAGNPSEQQKFTKLLTQSLFPKDFMIEGANGSLLFPQCGAISPPRIKEALMGKLTLKTATDITALTQVNADDPADAVIICSGPASTNFPETSHLPLDPVRGQITFLDGSESPSAPQSVLCGKGYLIPPLLLKGKKTIITGASFGRQDMSTDIRLADHHENQENARALWPQAGDFPIIGGRCALRAYSPDHLPFCGPVSDFSRYKDAYRALKHGPKHKEFIPAPYVKNLYILSGLGARGFMVAPLLADIMTALISGGPLPVTKETYESLHPARFQIRNLAKGIA